jgi:hypothetical protein
MLQHGYDYAPILATSQRINWRIEDVIGGDKRLDFTKPFLPESLARVEPLKFLDREEKLALNHIRANGYLYIFGLTEEFILPFLMDHMRPRLMGNDARMRALFQFAGEEAKHIDLFHRFAKEFEAGFGTRCQVIGPPEEIGKAVLAHDPLSVALLILGIEWMTQRHYTDSIKDDKDLCPQFSSLLRHHWMEEAQHAKLDTLMVESMAAGLSAGQIAKAMDGYMSIGGLFDGGLKQQVEFDIEAFVTATGRRLSEAERAEMAAQQHQAQRWTFLGSGMSHPNFLASVGAISPAARTNFEKVVPSFS